MHENKTDEIIKKIFFGNCNVLTPFQLLINKCHVCLPVGKIYYLYGRSYIVMNCLFSLTLTPQAHRDLSYTTTSIYPGLQMGAVITNKFDFK